jgi:arginine N-succinyltransferase
LKPLYVIRAVREDDAVAVSRLRALAGPGFTSLAVADSVLAERVERSAALFSAALEKPEPDQRYMLALEHVESGRVVGISAVKACVGESPPFFNFRVLRIAQASAAAQRRFDMEVLILVNEFSGCSEVGSLFVHPQSRSGGVGRALAQSRYLLMAAAPRRFAPVVVSELRGVSNAAGVSPFWEHLGRHFFKMTFEEADRLSATTDNQFILDLMPKYPIYVDLLPEAARDVIGACHADGAGARRLLEWEGFRYDRVVDIFDAGPLLSAGRETIRTYREAQRRSVRVVDRVDAPKRALAATADLASWRCAPVDTDVGEDGAKLSAATASVLGVADGQDIIVWSDHAH